MIAFIVSLLGLFVVVLPATLVFVLEPRFHMVAFNLLKKVKVNVRIDVNVEMIVQLAHENYINVRQNWYYYLLTKKQKQKTKTKTKQNKKLSNEKVHILESHDLNSSKQNKINQLNNNHRIYFKLSLMQRTTLLFSYSLTLHRVFRPLFL